VAGMSGSYLHWGVIQISVTNAIVIVAMVLVFALAVTIPLRGRRHDTDRKDKS
jgi:uncharacterized membrane protein